MTHHTILVQVELHLICYCFVSKTSAQKCVRSVITLASNQWQYVKLLLLVKHDLPPLLFRRNQVNQLVEEETRRYRPTKNYLDFLATPDYEAFEVGDAWRMSFHNEIVCPLSLVTQQSTKTNLCNSCYIYRRQS